MGVGNFLKKRVVLIILGIVGLIIILNLFVFKKPAQEYVLAEAVKGDIVQTVSVTGSIKADPSIDLHFQKTGQIKEILVKEGDEVVRDQLLASLDNQNLDLEMQSRQANLDFTRAQYEQTRAGAKYEEIQIAEADVKSAQAGFEAALVELDNTKKIGESNINVSSTAYNQALATKNSALKEFETTKSLAEKELANLELTGDNKQSLALQNAYDTARTQLNSYYTLYQEIFPLAESIIGVNGTGYYLFSISEKINLRNNYYDPAHKTYKDSLALFQSLKATSTNEEVDIVIQDTIDTGNSILLLLSQIGNKLEGFGYSSTNISELISQVQAESSQLSNATLQLQETQNTISTLNTGSKEDIETLKLSYQLQIDAAETKYKTAENALYQSSQNLEQTKLNAQIADKNAEAATALRKAALDSAKAMLELRKSPARNVDLAPLAAQISQAQIALQMSQKDYKDSQIYSPIDGEVTFIYGDVGENVSISETALKSFITINADDLIVEANVPETDIVKIKTNDKVSMTIDAFDFVEKFYGEVISMEPAETVIQGVIYYKIKTAFNVKDDRIRSGMTVNLDIETDKKTGVLQIPIRALKYEDSKKYVEVPTAQGPKKIYITTGIENDQYAEVLTGLKEGDKVITFVK